MSFGVGPFGTFAQFCSSRHFHDTAPFFCIRLSLLTLWYLGKDRLALHFKHAGTSGWIITAPRIC